MLHYPQRDVIIIGAGPAGLACAIKCQEMGKDFLLLECSDRAGGKLGSIYEKSYIYDLGFQVYNSSYKLTNSLLDMPNIDFNYFKPGALIHSDGEFQVLSDPIRNPSKTFDTLFSNIATLSDKLKILLLKARLRGYTIKEDNSFDVTTIDYIKGLGFSEKIIEKFFIPFLGGIFLEKELSTSSKFFKYVFSNFNDGIACLPENGMQSIPNNLLRKIDKSNILFNRKVLNISGNKIFLENGDFIGAKAFVLTGESSALVSNMNVRYNNVKTFYFSSTIKHKGGNYIHLFPNDNLINNIAILTSISKSYSKKQDNLISVSVLKSNPLKFSILAKELKRRLINYYGGKEKDYKFLKYFNLKKATLFQGSGYFQNHGLKRKGNIILSGEKTANGSIEGAVSSGLKAASLI